MIGELTNELQERLIKDCWDDFSRGDRKDYPTKDFLRDYPTFDNFRSWNPRGGHGRGRMGKG